MKSSTLVTLLASVFAIASTVFLARFELHTDDTGVEAGLMLLCALILGAVHPRHAWVWALVPGSAIALATAWNHFYGPQQGAPPLSERVLVMAFVTAIGLVGAYSGVGLRRAVSSSGRPSEPRP